MNIGNLNMMVIFDIIIGILGAYLVVKGIVGTKKGEVDPMLVTAEELVRVKDKAGFAQYLMPKCTIFGAYCVFFAVVGIIYDMEYLKFNKLVYGLFLVSFCIAWTMFTVYLKKGKNKYIQ